MDPLQNFPTTSLHKLCEAEGYSLFQFAKIFGAAINTIKDWELHRRRPEFQHLERLAEHFNRPVVFFEELLWGEKEDDPCPHGWCNGIKIKPTNPLARHLDIQVFCNRCGHPVQHRDKQRMQNHRAAHCENCRYIPVCCPGYEIFFGEPRFAKNHDGEKRSIRSSRYAQCLSADKDQTGCHPAHCGPCGSGAAMVRTLIDQVKEHLKKAREQLGTDLFKELTGWETIPEIQNYQDLSLHHRLALRIHYRDHNGELVRFRNRKDPDSPGFRGTSLPKDLDDEGKLLLPKEAIKKKPRNPFRMTSRSIGQLVRSAKDGRANYIAGICCFCKKVLFTQDQIKCRRVDGLPRGDAVRTHSRCQSVRGRRGFRPVPPTAKGGQHKVKVWQQRCCWTILRVVEKWEIDRIAKHFDRPDFHPAPKTIEGGILKFRRSLPEKNLVPEPFQPLVSLLRDPDGHRDKRRFWTAHGAIDPSFRISRKPYRAARAIQ